jgi:hypothetical protein
VAGVRAACERHGIHLGLHSSSAVNIAETTAPSAASNEVVVGHAYPFYSLVGGQYLDEGQAAILRPQGTTFEVLARVGLKEWRELAALPSAK